MSPTEDYNDMLSRFIQARQGKKMQGKPPAQKKKKARKKEVDYKAMLDRFIAVRQRGESDERGEKN